MTILGILLRTRAAFHERSRYDILEIEREGDRLHQLLNARKLNTMTREEFYEVVVATMDRLSASILDFDTLHFGGTGQPLKQTEESSSPV